MDSRDLSGVGWSVLFGSCLDRLPELADNSVDAVVCDPPYELGFMGKSWDSSGIAFSSAVWAECLRVLKPGGHLLAFGGSRTWHRIAVAVEDAGFEIRDSIAWLYGSGFPKSLDVSKAIDKAAGAEREVIGYKTKSANRGASAGASIGGEPGGYNFQEKHDLTSPATADAVKWQGWGTALKPAFEPVIVGRKPLVGTVAANVLLWGTGGLNIDGTRIGSEGGTRDGDFIDGTNSAVNSLNASRGGSSALKKGTTTPTGQGRWPSNVMLDEVTAGLVDEQSGWSASSSGITIRGQRKIGAGWTSREADVNSWRGGGEFIGHGDAGGASRFFYVAKASKRDRNEGLDGLEKQNKYKKGGVGGTGGKRDVEEAKLATPVQNFHPTVKPTDLMRQLVRLVTPPGGVVLDPFTGSGSTGKAAILEGFQFIGCELTEDYLPIIQGRIDWAVAEVARLADMEEEKLF